jgi:N-hydroxyarylamine O-acetyltransferase
VRPRILVLGCSTDILESVLRELTDYGLAVDGSAEPETAAAHFDARDFGLIAFGGGLRGAPKKRLEAAFARQNPAIRFLDAWAPFAVQQIVAALEHPGPTVDLDAYCARIGYDGPRRPTLETLKALIPAHIGTIAFEAIDVLLGRGIDLAPAAVDAKLIKARRGGYCFEQNGLFKRVLEAMGFAVEGLVARVRWMRPAGAPLVGRTHMALRVTLDGVPWLADVGFGGCVPAAPLRMDDPAPQQTPHETLRLIPFGSGLLLQAEIDGRRQPLYDLSPEPQTGIDYELANWFTAQHPSSPFRSDLMVAKTTPEARFNLLDNRLTIRRAGSAVERHVLDAAALEVALRDIFGLPLEPAWRPLIERAAAPR